MALTLKNAFEATFRSNYRFEDFLDLKVEQAATRKKLGDREIVQPNAELKAYLRFFESITSDDVLQVFTNKLSQAPITDWPDYQAVLAWAQRLRQNDIDSCFT